MCIEYLEELGAIGGVLEGDLGRSSGVGGEDIVDPLDAVERDFEDDDVCGFGDVVAHP